MFWETSVNQYLRNKTCYYFCDGKTKKQFFICYNKAANHTVRKFPNYVELLRSFASEGKGMQFRYQFFKISLTAYKTAIPLCNSKEKTCQS